MLDENGYVFLEGGPYTDGNLDVQTATGTATNGCYQFNIHDSYGDGICCTYGNGSFVVKAGKKVVIEGGEYASLDIKDVDAPLSIVEESLILLTQVLQTRILFYLSLQLQLTT